MSIEIYRNLPGVARLLMYQAMVPENNDWRWFKSFDTILKWGKVTQQESSYTFTTELNADMTRTNCTWKLSSLSQILTDSIDVYLNNGDSIIESDTKCRTLTVFCRFEIQFAANSDTVASVKLLIMVLVQFFSILRYTFVFSSAVVNSWAIYMEIF